MDEVTFPLLVVAAVFAAVIGYYGVHRWIRRRRQARIRWVAGKMGFHQACQPGETLKHIWRERFLLLGAGRKNAGHGVENLLQGRVQGRQVYLFDLEETLSREANTWHSVLVIEAGKQRWPKFALHPQKLEKERFTQRLRTAAKEFACRGMAGYRKTDVRIEGYRLSCPPGSEQKVRELFDAELVRYFSGHQKFALEGSGRYLLIYLREHLVASDELEAFIREACSIHRLFLSPVDRSDGRQSGRRCRADADPAPSSSPLG